MPKLSPINSQKLVRILEKWGFKKLRQKGSHLRLGHKDGRRTTVPIYAGENIGKGLLGKILRDVNVSPEEFEKLR